MTTDAPPATTVPPDAGKEPGGGATERVVFWGAITEVFNGCASHLGLRRGERSIRTDAAVVQETWIDCSSHERIPQRGRHEKLGPDGAIITLTSEVDCGHGSWVVLDNGATVRVAPASTAGFEDQFRPRVFGHIGPGLIVDVLAESVGGDPAELTLNCSWCQFSSARADSPVKPYMLGGIVEEVSNSCETGEYLDDNGVKVTRTPRVRPEELALLGPCNQWVLRVNGHPIEVGEVRDPSWQPGVAVLASVRGGFGSYDGTCASCGIEVVGG